MDLHIRSRRAGFTLLELMTVIVVIAILVTLLMPTVAGVRDKAYRANCINNLKALYVAAAGHIQEKERWPQVPAGTVRTPAYAKAWIAALEPHGLSPKNWICPSVQRQLKDPDYTKPGKVRVDYIATAFDSSPRSPYKWVTQPWFVERADIHGDGNLLIFSNGEVKSLRQVLMNRQRQEWDQ